MSTIKIITTIYFVLLTASIGVLYHIYSGFNQILESSSILENISTQYAQLQKDAGMIGIVSFMVLLCISFVLYYLTDKKSYILLSNIIYIVVILYVFITVNREFYTFQNLEFDEQSEYWITVFMGIFYIIGAVLVSAIGYITIRNYSKRSQHIINKTISKK